MGKSRYSDELERALARPDADAMCEQIDAYAAYFAVNRNGEWPEEYADAFEQIVTCFHDDPDKAFAYVVLAAARSDDAGFLGLMACGVLEDVLTDPSFELLERIVAEARKSR